MSPLPTRPVRRLQFSRTSACWSQLVPSWLWWDPVGLENQPWSLCCSGCMTPTPVRASLFCLVPDTQIHQPLFSNQTVFFPGIISIDGHDIRDLNPYWLRSHIGTVSQVINDLLVYSRSHSTYINWADTHCKY